MFEIEASDIASLGDADLRSLVYRLAVAELRANGCPVSSVTAGGNQDAADGGLDVRVECPCEIASPDFVKRRLTGFQVKKPDMPAKEIQKEMRPKNLLRGVIGELANGSGSYVIVSSKGSVADAPLKARQKAMRDALQDHPNAEQLHTDFYDRDRLAAWVNEHPGIINWVRSRTGRPLSGWIAIGDWEGRETDPKPYLFDETACIIDERSADKKNITILEGIANLRRLLRTPRQCVRLVGLSGLGKTRFVQALFEDCIGESPLEPSLAVYTDYSEEPIPTAREMARNLVARGKPAILVVDNCNPATHADLVKLCAGNSSKVSLITVEYDISDDEPENTEVFRINSTSPTLVTKWIEQIFPDISEVDRVRISAFSDGNFRVARALAQTIGRGETLGSLKDRELFRRILHQRNDLDQDLLRAAEDLSLFYSIEGEDLSKGGELELVGQIREVGARPLYEALAEMRRRGVVQARGAFRAVLPHAIANPLASDALRRIPPAVFDRFCATMKPRMLKSIARRLGLLHDSSYAKDVVERWLGSDGPLGNLFQNHQVIFSIAPVLPELILQKLEVLFKDIINGKMFALSDQNHYQWFPLIKALAYDASLFDRSLALLARMLIAQGEVQTNDAAEQIFRELFQVHLSGTQASPQQRRFAIRQLVSSGHPELCRIASIALRSLLNANNLSSMSNPDFGARSRDWGWRPQTHQQKWDWFTEAVNLAVDLEPHLPDVRSILACSLRTLWKMKGCREAIEHAATALCIKRPWIEAWSSLRLLLKLEGKSMPKEIREQLERLIHRLKPTDLLSKARAVIHGRMRGGWDIADEKENEDPVQASLRASNLAVEVGKSLASEHVIRGVFLSELLVAPQPQRVFEIGRGLGQGTNKLKLGEMWAELTAAYELAKITRRSPTVLAGFLCEANKFQIGFAASQIEAALANPCLVACVPYFQGQIGIDEEGISRLRRAIAKGGLLAEHFRVLSCFVDSAPPVHLSVLLEDIASLMGGADIALDILEMHFQSEPNRGDGRNPQIIAVGRKLLAAIDFKAIDPHHDYCVQNVMRACLVGEGAVEATERVCANINLARENYFSPSFQHDQIFTALFEVQPIIALDGFLQPKQPESNVGLFEVGLKDFAEHIARIEPEIVLQWVNVDPDLRCYTLGKCLSLFESDIDGGSSAFCQLFLSVLEVAPDKYGFLGNLWDRLHPIHWSGSLVEILISRKAMVIKLAEDSGGEVRAWVVKALPELEHWIEHASRCESRAEQSFE